MKLWLTHPSVGTFAYRLKPGMRLVLGRDASQADLGLVWDKRISRKHATLYEDHGAWWFQDLASRNGSWVEGRRVHEPLALGPGVRVSIGDTHLEVAHEWPDPWAEITISTDDDPSSLAEALGVEPISKTTDLPKLSSGPRTPLASQPVVPSGSSSGRQRETSECPDEAPVPVLRGDPPESSPVGSDASSSPMWFGDERRVRIEGLVFGDIWQRELSKGALFVPGASTLGYGARVVIDLKTCRDSFELTGEVVYVGPGPNGLDGAGLSVPIPERLRTVVKETCCSGG